MVLFTNYREGEYPTFLRKVDTYCEGHYTPFKAIFLRTEGFPEIFKGIFIRTIGFSGKVYEILGSDLPPRFVQIQQV